MANLVLAPNRAATLPGDTSARPAWPHPVVVGRLLGVVGAGCALGFMVLLHLIAGSAIDPMTATMSDTVFAPGVGWMFTAGVLSMAVSGFGVVVILRADVSRVRRLAMVAGWLAAVGLVLVALFPTDPEGAASLSAQIHRYAAAVVMVAIPVAALSVASVLPRTPRGSQALRATALVSCVVVVLTGVAIFLPGVFDPVRGVMQRALLLGELVVLAQLIQVSARAARRMS